MAFEQENVQTNVEGRWKKVIGRFTATGVTLGTIYTGLSQVYHCKINNETANRGVAVPGSNGQVAVSALTDGDTGTFEAVGV